MTTAISALAFRTGIVPGPVGQITPVTLTFSVAADGSLFSMDGSSLYYHDPVHGMMNVAAVNSSASFESQALAALSRGQVYCIGWSSTQQLAVLEWTTDGGVTALTALPNGITPQSVSVAADGTLWVGGSDGKPYSYANDEWTAVTAPPGAIQILSVGNATFAVALIQQDVPQVMLYQNGAWSSLDTGAAFVAACPDGSYWLYHPPTLLLMPAGGAAPVSFQVPTLQGLTPVFSAPTKYGCYFFNGAAGLNLNVAAYGVVDQPATDWPALTGTQQQAYNAISNTVGAIGEGGIRAQYSNLNAPIAEWYAQVQTMTCPSGVSASDWTIVQAEVLSELEAVTSVDSLFTNLAILADKVGLIQTDTYDDVLAMVGLPSNSSQQPTSIVSIILGKIFDYMIGAAMEAVPKEVAKTINAGMSIFKFAGDFVAQRHGAPDCDTAFQLACAKLSDELAGIVTNIAQTTGTLQGAILSDWGKLTACGNAIASGTWYWPPSFDYSVLANVGKPTRVHFYQTLMPAKWQIMLFESLNGVPQNTPQYSFVAKYVQDANGNVLSWWWICAAQGADVSLQTTGPWPAQNLIEEINNNITSIYDFFTGANGWTLPSVQSDGYLPPIDGVPWTPWVDSASPLG